MNPPALPFLTCSLTYRSDPDGRRVIVPECRHNHFKEYIINRNSAYDIRIFIYLYDMKKDRVSTRFNFVVMIDFLQRVKNKLQQMNEQKNETTTISQLMRKLLQDWLDNAK